MGQMITVTGMVLAAYPYGDYDKRITLLTKERGKITAFARGARKQNSPLLAVCNSFVTGDFTVYEGRSSYNLMQAKARNYFHELSADFAGACYGFYFCELADYYTREASDELPMLKLLYQTLRAMESGRFDRGLIRDVYELKTLAINGEYPNVFSCLRCGRKEELDFFNMKLRGCVCRDCAGEPGDEPLDASVLYAMQFIISTPVEKLYTFVLAPQTLRKGENTLCVLCNDIGMEGGILGNPVLRPASPFTLYTDEPIANDDPYRYFHW